MNYFKKLFSKTSETVKNLIKKLPITLAIIIFATIFITIDIEQSSKFYGKIILFCTVFAVEAFFTEICFYKKKIYRIITYIVSAVVAISFTVLILGDLTKDYVSTFIRVLIGYLLILFLIAIYKIIKENVMSFKNYALKIFTNIFNASITYLVLNIGLTLITVIVVELLLDSWGDILGRIQILLLGLFYVPALINSLCDVKEKEVNTFIQRLVKYVMLPLVVVAMLIIYMYIMKILVLKEIPSNVIFRILAGIFIVAFPVWNMAGNFGEESKFIKKTTSLLPYFYMPFIILEVYSLYVRILGFGITPIRYFGIVFIVLQIIALALTIIKKGEKLSQLFIYMAVLVAIAFILPLNYSKVSILSQKGILKEEFPENLKYESLSKESKKRLAGAYAYLMENDAEKDIPEYIKKHKEEIYSEDYKFNRINSEDIFVSDNKEVVDISGYSKLIEVNYNPYSPEWVENSEIKTFVQKAINTQYPEEYIKENRLVKINESESIYIRYLSGTYDKDTKEIEYISIDGYALYK